MLYRFYKFLNKINKRKKKMTIDKFLLNQRKLAELFTIEVQSNTDEDSVKRV